MRRSACISICLLVLLKPAYPQKKAASSQPNSAFVGQFYNVGDHQKKAWLGFRLCNYKAGAHAILNVTSGGWHASFSLPFSGSSNSGKNWQRLSREKAGCDLVLIKSNLSQTAPGFSWSVQGSRSQSGKVVFKKHAWTPFSLPSSRIVQRHKPIPSLKSSHKGR